LNKTNYTHPKSEQTNQWGEDEFVVVAAGVTAASAAMIVAVPTATLP